MIAIKFHFHQLTVIFQYKINIHHQFNFTLSFLKSEIIYKANISRSAVHILSRSAVHVLSRSAVHVLSRSAVQICLEVRCIYYLEVQCIYYLEVQ